MFILSRLYVPVSFYMLYRRGVFGESFSFGEFKYVGKMVVMMHLLDCSGHFMMRKMTESVYDKHIGFDEEQSYSKKKMWDDYATQKSYFKNKKEGKAGIQ